MRQVVFEAMASGFSIEEIAEMRKVSPRTIRREVDRTLNERRLDAPERYVHFQVARLTKVVRVADAGLDRGDLRAIGPMIKAVKELDRYHGLREFCRAALPAPRLPPPPLRLASAAAALACRPRESGGPEAVASTLQSARPGPGAGFHRHGAESPVAPAHESDFVTGFATQTLEIMGRLPELQPAPDGSGEPCDGAGAGAEAPTRRPYPSSPRTGILTGIRGAAEGGPPQDEESCDNGARLGGCFVTDFAAQPFEIMGSLPELQPAPDDRDEPGEPGADAGTSTPRPHPEEPKNWASRRSAPAVDEGASVTDSAGQALEITQSLPELQPASEACREGPEAVVGAADEHADPRVLLEPSGAGGRDAAEPGDRHVTPESAPRLYDRWVGHEEWARGRNPWRSRSTVSTDRIHA
jgi:hypothetical protein